jgi:twitching motility protein PilI
MSRKNTNSLREFQARLTDRLKLASTQKTVSAHLGVQIGEERYLVELADAGEIVPVPVITQVPLTQDWFRGIANLRGVLYSVSDLARYMGMGPTPVDRDARLLALGSRLNFNASIIVSRMLGLRNVVQMQEESAAQTGTGILGKCYRDAQGVVWRELRLTELIQDERFLLVGR